MEPRVETAYLLDFYGALLTPKRREMLRMRCLLYTSRCV